MDIQLAKTFLEIMSLGSFQEAANALNITQTAVTARVKSLEAELGCRLFIRNRSGATLTQDGERFVEHAKRLIAVWQQAQTDMSLPEGFSNQLTLGAENSLWNPLLVNVIKQLQEYDPQIALNAEVNTHDVLLSGLQNNVIDLALVHTPNYHTQLTAELLLEEKLIHVASAANPKPNLFVNWGKTFIEQYDASLPTPRQSGFQCNLGPLALKIMLEQGGNGYFRTRVVQKYLNDGRLVLVPHAQEFSYPVFIVYKKANENPTLSAVIEILKKTAKDESYWLV